MTIAIAILGLALVAALLALGRARERNASLREAVVRLEQEREAAWAERSRLGDLSSDLEQIAGTVEQLQRTEQQGQQLLAGVRADVSRGTERIDSLVGRWANPKQRSQLGEAWLVGALRRMNLRDGVHFGAQERVRIQGTRGSREGVIDVLLHLPNGNGLALDSKFPWGVHLASVLDGNEEARDFELRRLRDALRAHVKDIAGREYHRAVGVDVRHVLIVVPDWQTLDLVKGIDPQLTQFAASRGVGLVPADGLYEIAAALGELHREEGWGERIRELFSPADADAMYAASEDLLVRLERVVGRHNSSGDAIAGLIAAFGPNGLVGRDVLAPAARAADKVALETEGELGRLEPGRAERHRERLEAQRPAPGEAA